VSLKIQRLHWTGGDKFKPFGLSKSILIDSNISYLSLIIAIQQKFQLGAKEGHDIRLFKKDNTEIDLDSFYSKELFGKGAEVRFCTGKPLIVTV